MNALPLVIYHANCADGFTAAWAVHKAMPADFHAASHGHPPPDVTGRDVILVDFCYSADVMYALQRQASSVLVLDHHRTADDTLPDNNRLDQLYVFRIDPDHVGDDELTPWQTIQNGNQLDREAGVAIPVIFAMIDQTRSGAGIAWDFFHPGKPRPPLVDHVEDRDLWRFALPGTREIQLAVFARPYSFEAWDALAGMDPQDLRREGEILDRKQRKDVAELVAACVRRMTIGGHSVPAASIPYCYASEAGASMAQGEPFAACYYDTATTREFSLRSNADGLDVAAIASAYGGGGHTHAAGFRVPRDHELARA